MYFYIFLQTFDTAEGTMLIAIQIKNFAEMNQAFSFFADTKEKKGYSHLIKIPEGRMLSVIGFPQTAKEADTFFYALDFIRQLVIRTDASLNHPNIAKYLDMINDTAEFTVIFRFWGNIYRYRICLTKEKISEESLCIYYKFDKKNPFSFPQADWIFEREENAYPTLNMHKSLWEQIQNTPQNAAVLSLFKEKEKHNGFLNAAHNWFRKELFVFEDKSFLDFMSGRGIFYQGCELLEGQRISAEEAQKFISRDITQYLANPENAFFTVHIRENAIILHKKLPDKNTINICISVSSETFRKFILTLHAIKNEKYRVFAIPRMTDTLEGLYAYLLVKTFLSDRYEYYNQIFFSSNDYRMFSAGLLRKDEIFILQNTEQQESSIFLSADSPENLLKKILPPPHIPETKLEDNRNSFFPVSKNKEEKRLLPWWLIVFGLIFLLFLPSPMGLIMFGVLFLANLFLIFQ